MSKIELSVEWLEGYGPIPIVIEIDRMLQAVEPYQLGTLSVLVDKSKPSEAYEDASHVVYALRTIANLIEAEPNVLHDEQAYDDFMLNSGVDLRPGGKVRAFPRVRPPKP